jgi:hypothetical protein
MSPWWEAEIRWLPPEVGRKNVVPAPVLKLLIALDGKPPLGTGPCWDLTMRVLDYDPQSRLMRAIVALCAPTAPSDELGVGKQYALYDGPKIVANARIIAAADSAGQ